VLPHHHHHLCFDRSLRQTKLPFCFISIPGNRKYSPSDVGRNYDAIFDDMTNRTCTMPLLPYWFAPWSNMVPHKTITLDKKKNLCVRKLVGKTVFGKTSRSLRNFYIPKTKMLMFNTILKRFNVYINS
jgi:hypothetical protein